LFGLDNEVPESSQKKKNGDMGGNTPSTNTQNPGGKVLIVFRFRAQPYPFQNGGVGLDLGYRRVTVQALSCGKRRKFT